jgi:coenzyme F420-reducing hydrogenase gamma subunit
MSKPRLAIFDFACCEGCQLQIVNLEEELLDLLNVVEPVEWREAMAESSDEFDIAIVEGSITREQDAERLKWIRERAGVLIALGACATTGGVNKLKNMVGIPKAQKEVYGDHAADPHLATAPTMAADEIVTVDYYVHGCPMDRKEFTYIVRCVALGKTPEIPTYPVCVECKQQGNVCRYEYGEVCLGVITRAGCRARCPSGGGWCFGCRGLAPDPNVEAAKEVMEYYGKTRDDLIDRMKLFANVQEATHAENR